MAPMADRLAFTKGHGTENDFVLVPDLDGALGLSAERAAALADRRAGIGADGVIRLVERNCAIHRIAADTTAACQAELDLFREILGPEVVRETHIAAGDRCCTYRIGEGRA